MYIFKHLVFSIVPVLLCISTYASDRHALIIGINHYKAGKYASEIKLLNGCVNDAMSVKGLISTRFGFTDKDIQLLIDSQATKTAIQAGFEALIDHSKKDDVVLIYYAGHGVSFTNSFAQKEQKTTQGIVSCNLDEPYNSVIFDFELSAYYNRLIEKGAIVSVIFDCCHSGDMPMNAGRYRDYSYQLSQRGLDIDNFTVNPENDDNGIRKIEALRRDLPSFSADLFLSNQVERPHEKRGSGFMYFSAAQSAQVSLEIIDADGMVHGVFTKALLSVYEKNSVHLPLATLFDLLQKQMTTNYSPVSSHPIFSSSPAILCDSIRMQQNLLAIDDHLLEDAIEIPIQAQMKEQVVLAAGIYYGLHRGNVLTGTKDSSILVRINQAPGHDSASAKLIRGSVQQLQKETKLLLSNRSKEVQPLMKIYRPTTQYTLAEYKNLYDQLQPLIQSKAYWPYEEWGDPAYSVQFDNRQCYLAPYQMDFTKSSIKYINALAQSDSLRSTICLYLPVAKEWYEYLQKKLEKNPNFIFTNNAQEANFNLYTSCQSDGKIIMTLTNSIIGKRMQYLEDIQSGKRVYSSAHQPDRKFKKLADPFAAGMTVTNMNEIYRILLQIASQLQWQED